MVRLRFVFRQIAGSSRQSLLFVLCVALSLIVLVSLGSFRLRSPYVDSRLTLETAAHRDGFLKRETPQTLFWGVSLVRLSRCLDCCLTF